MFVYLLQCVSTKRTYIGATVNLDRRLRQHNGEIKGGAKSTKGKKWIRIAYVSGFPDWNSTLQFEWRWKNLSRKHIGTPLQKRWLALHQLLGLDRCTKKSIPFSKWGEILIHIEHIRPK